MEEKYFTYKGLPLVRNGNQIYYGSMSGETVATLQIMNTKKIKDLEVADRIKVRLMLTETDGADASEIMVKTCERSGLYEALDVAYIWLNKNNRQA